MFKDKIKNFFNPKEGEPNKKKIENIVVFIIILIITIIVINVIWNSNEESNNKQTTDSSKKLAETIIDTDENNNSVVVNTKDELYCDITVSTRLSGMTYPLPTGVGCILSFICSFVLYGTGNFTCAMLYSVRIPTRVISLGIYMPLPRFQSSRVRRFLLNSFNIPAGKSERLNTNSPQCAMAVSASCALPMGVAGIGSTRFAVFARLGSK